MERRRRAELLVAWLRWLVIGFGLAAASDSMPLSHLAALLCIVTIYNGAILFCASEEIRFAQHGRRLAMVGRLMDAALVTSVLFISSEPGSLAYLLYWFVLVSFGYTNTDLRRLAVAGGGVIGANAAATVYAVGSTGQTNGLWGTLAIRSAVLVFGLLVSAFIAKSRSQDDLASERGSYLHAILDCGAKLTSFRNVHELALYVLESAITQTKACGGELLLVNDESHELECEAFFTAGNAPQNGGAPSESLLKSYANWVVNSGREFLVQTGGKSSDEAAAVQDDHPAIAVPLLWHSSGADDDSSALGVLIVWGYSGEQFGEDALDILRIFAAIAGAAIVNLRLYTNLQKSFLSTLQSLANGLEARDEYTRGHSERVMQVACLLAEELGVPGESIESLRNAALLHDIGKIGVPDAILRKAGKLTAEEWETMRRHPIVSEEICRPLGLAPEILFLVKHHHERLDGKGYPGGIPAREQPLLQRILVVADSFDAMRSRRPYRDRMPQEELISELNISAGRTLDPTVVDALRHLMDNGKLDIVYEEHDRAIDGTVIAKKAHRQQAA